MSFMKTLLKQSIDYRIYIVDDTLIKLMFKQLQSILLSLLPQLLYLGSTGLLS